MTFNISCWPGLDSAARTEQVSPGGLALVLYMAAGNVIVQPPPVSAEGPLVLARFCRQLSHAARQLADELDPPSQGLPSLPSPGSRSDSGPRHRLAPGESDAGWR